VGGGGGGGGVHIWNHIIPLNRERSKNKGGVRMEQSKENEIRSGDYTWDAESR